MSGESSTEATASFRDEGDAPIQDESYSSEAEAVATATERGAKPEILQILSVLAVAHAVGLFYTDHPFGALVLLAAGIAGITGRRLAAVIPFVPLTYWDWVGECHQKATKLLSARGRIERQPFCLSDYQRYDGTPLHLSEIATLETIFLAASLSSSSVEKRLEEATVRIHILEDTKYRADTAFAAILLSLAASELLPPELSDVTQKGLGLGFQMARDN